VRDGYAHLQIYIKTFHLPITYSFECMPCKSASVSRRAMVANEGSDLPAGTVAIYLEEAFVMERAIEAINAWVRSVP